MSRCVATDDGVNNYSTDDDGADVNGIADLETATAFNFSDLKMFVIMALLMIANNLMTITIMVLI